MIGPVLRGTSTLAISLFLCTAGMARADEAPAAAAEASDVATGLSGDTIIVTGSSKAQKKFDVSYAVTTLSNDDIQKMAPLNFADLLGQLPGIHAEATGGEVQNVYRIRGIPNEGSFQAFQQDGMPIYGDNDGNFFKGDVLNRTDLMTRTVEFVRGGPSPVFASNAAAIYNQITVRGTDTPEGAVRVTVGDTDLYRLDAYSAGPLGQNTYYAIGGFLRQNDGARYSGFPADKGGQVRANIVRELDNGEIRLSGTYLNDRNLFYLPIPVADPRDPSVSLDPYLDYFKGTMNSPVLQNARMRYSDGEGGTMVEDRDLSNGRHTRYFMLGLDYTGNFGEWTVSAKGRYTDGKVDFDALYSTSNPQDGTAFANSYLSAAQTAFGSNVAYMGYAIAGTNGQTLYDPNSASGLVTAAQYRAVSSDFYSTQGDLRITRDIKTGLGTHSIAFGAYGTAYGTVYRQRYQDYLFEIATQPRTLDLVAYSAAGDVLGYVTDNGVLRYATTLTGGKSDVTMWALYANDSWQVTDKLRIDGGIRHEAYSYKGYGLGQVSGVDLGDPTTLADDSTRAFNGTINNRNLTKTVTPWTLGANYDISRHFGLYGRISEAYRVPGESIVYSTGTPVTTKARQYEAGLKISLPMVQAYFTGFYTKFDPFNASFLAYNPQTGQNNQTLTFIGQAETKGVEADISVRPIKWLTLAGTLTVSDPTMSNLVNEFGASAAAVEGNQLVREPKVYGNFRPSVNFDIAGTNVDAYLRYNYVGKRYVDLYNLTELPSYDTLGAGFTLSRGTWQFQVVGDNITNAKGLTEGNPRTDQLSGQGASTAIYGRPVFGRSFRFVLTKRW